MSQNEGYYGSRGQLQPKFVHGEMFPMQWVKIFIQPILVWQMFTLTVKELTLSMLTASFLYFLKKNLSGTLSECQMIWIQIKTDILLPLIWVQTVCKDYQQTTKVAASKERVKAVYIMCTRREFSGIINLFSVIINLFSENINLFSRFLNLFSRIINLLIHCSWERTCRTSPLPWTELWTLAEELLALVVVE